MKKIIHFLIGSFLGIQSLEAISLKEFECWIESHKAVFSYSFSEDTDLILGYRTLKTKLLEKWRHYGVGHFNKGLLNGCSYKDTSEDPMTQLLIYLFPSSGVDDFNAGGSHSIEFFCKNRDQLTAFISGALRLSNDVRSYLTTRTSSNPYLGEIVERFLRQKNEQKWVQTGEQTWKFSGIELSKALDKRLLEYIGFFSKKMYMDALIEAWKAIKSVLRSIPGGINDPSDIYCYSQYNGNEEMLNKLDVKKRKFLKKMSNVYELQYGFRDFYSNKINNSGLKDLVNESIKCCIDEIPNLPQNYRNALNGDHDVMLCVERLKEISTVGCWFIDDSDSLIRENMLLRLKFVLLAVLRENLTGDYTDSTWEKYPYYTGCTNNIMLAYAWNVLNQNDLDRFSRLLRFGRSQQGPYSPQSALETCKAVPPSHIPFDPETRLGAYGNGFYYQDKSGIAYNFSDCAETVLRQIFALLFCKVDNFGNMRLEYNRIPKNSQLWSFFRGKSIFEAANARDDTTRKEWATICSNHEGIGYQQNNVCELLGGKGYNLLKLLCLLMKDYTAKGDCEPCSPEARQRKQNAEDFIKGINNGASIENLSYAFNQILGIRSDILTKVYEEEGILGYKNVYIYLQKPPIHEDKIELNMSSGHCEGKVLSNENSETESKSKNTIKLVGFELLASFFSSGVLELPSLKELFQKMPSLNEGWVSFCIEDESFPFYEEDLEYGNLKTSAVLFLKYGNIKSLDSFVRKYRKFSKKYPELEQAFDEGIIHLFSGAFLEENDINLFRTLIKKGPVSEDALLACVFNLFEFSKNVAPDIKKEAKNFLKEIVYKMDIHRLTREQQKKLKNVFEFFFNGNRSLDGISLLHRDTHGFLPTWILPFIRLIPDLLIKRNEQKVKETLENLESYGVENKYPLFWGMTPKQQDSFLGESQLKDEEYEDIIKFGSGPTLFKVFKKLSTSKEKNSRKPLIDYAVIRMDINTLSSDEWQEFLQILNENFAGERFLTTPNLSRISENIERNLPLLNFVSLVFNIEGVQEDFFSEYWKKHDLGSHYWALNSETQLCIWELNNYFKRNGIRDKNLMFPLFMYADHDLQIYFLEKYQFTVDEYKKILEYIEILEGSEIMKNCRKLTPDVEKLVKEKFHQYYPTEK